MKKYSRVCIVGTVYTLFFYYLNYSLKEIDRTLFFVNEGLSESILKKLPQYYYFKKKENAFYRFLLRFNLRFFSRFRWPFLRKVPICGLDHLTFSPGIIGNRSYTLLEDAPYIASFYFNSTAYKKNISQRSSRIRCFVIDTLFGDLFLRPFGDNKQCEQILFSKEDSAPALSGKNIQIRPLEQLWKAISKEKEERILHLFDIDQADIALLSSKSIIIFTQPFSSDGILSEEEQIEIYREIIRQNPSQEILLKLHPRDRIDYSQYFHDITIFDKSAPMQLLDLLNIRFKKAITVNSTSILSFPYDIETVWLGTKVHPKLQSLWGDIEMPDIKMSPDKNKDTTSMTNPN